MKVYLAGPITGLTFEEGQDWRVEAQKMLSPLGIYGYSPLRGKEYLKKEGVLVGSYEESPLSTAKGLTSRDRYDVMSCDAVLMYLKGAESINRNLYRDWLGGCVPQTNRSGSGQG